MVDGYAGHRSRSTRLRMEGRGDGAEIPGHPPEC